MTSQAAAAVPDAPKAAPWVIAPIVGLAAFMEVLDISIANVALQHIAGNLSASQDQSTWVLTSYLAANAIVLPMSGWIASTIGRRRYFLGCIIGFSITSLLCGLAPNLELLILFRALQGATGGGLQPNAQAILADAFPPNKRGQAFAAFGIAVIVAPVIGPTVGGWITDSFSWRWVFLLNVPVGVIVSLLAARVVVDPPERTAARLAQLVRGVRFDYIGFALLVVGMCSLQVVLDKGQQNDWWASSLILDLGIAAVVSLVAFVVWELNRDDPVVDLRLLKNPNFAIGSLLMFMLGFILNSSTVLLPQFVQALMGYTATDAGLVLSPGGLAAMFMMPIVGNLINRVDARWLIATGLATTAFGLFYMTRFYLDVDYNTFAWARIYQSVGLAFLFIPINTVAFIGVPLAKNNDASALINMMRNLGGSFGISLAITLLARRQQYHQSVLVEHVGSYSSQYHDTIQRLQQAFLARSSSTVDALHHAQAMVYAMVQKQAALLSYIDTFWVLAIGFTALVPLIFLLRKPTPGAGGPAGH
ncbi:MAG: DHA2 family efflux MFS transporter permease subunit [Alphaproteobacteria bacterium]|nr:DHA2 family efflux MFS transporter permease subunit [Alphaproteobacteria bacterium]